MSALIILLTHTFIRTSSASIPLSPWISGAQATKHTYAGSGSGTACGYAGSYGTDVDSYMYLQNGGFPFGFISAVGKVPDGSPHANLWTNNNIDGEGCGACYEIQCLGSFIGNADCVCNSAETVTVQALDLSGTNNEPHFDLSFAAFEVVAQSACGRIAINYRQVACEFNNNIHITTPYINPWYFEINFYNVAGNGMLCGVEFKGSTHGEQAWFEMQNIGSKWTGGDNVNGGNVAPLSLRLTDCAGNVVTALDVVGCLDCLIPWTDIGVNFAYGGSTPQPVVTPAPVTPAPVPSPVPSGPISYPLFVSYIGQIAVGWGVSYNEELLSNLGVPGYSSHPYNVLNFAFWFSSTNAGAYGTATGSWENIRTYITDSALLNTLTGQTNPSGEQLRLAIKNIYTANGIKIIVSAFGATDHPQTGGRNPSTVGTNLANYAIQYLYDGVDVDWEEGGFFMGGNAGQGETWLSTLTNTLYSILSPVNKLITHAPQAPYFMGNTNSQYPQGGYLTVHANVGSKIDWYNVQYYNQGSTTYSTYANMFVASVGWSPNTAVYQMINGNNPEGISIPANKIVIGKHSLDDGSDFVSGDVFKNILNQALAANSPQWGTGFMIWQFYTENNESPPFQVSNEAAAANWDPNATPTPTAVTPAPVTPAPISIGGGSGCVSGNICIKVRGFTTWWWSMYDENVIDSLTSGCAITDCSNIEVKHSSDNVWITGYNDIGDCGFDMNTAFTASISIDIKITTTTGQVKIAENVVTADTADAFWDFGSNIDSCSVDPVTPIPTADNTPAPSDATPAPTDSTPSPSDATPSPSDATPSPSDATPAPTDSTPAPSDSTPSPVNAPTSATPSPTDATPAPSDATPSPTDSTPAPSDSTPAPTDSTPAPTDNTPAPSDATPSPTDGTPSPSDSTPAPTDSTPAPSDTTPSPVPATAQPTDMTPEPTDSTPEPTINTPSPTDSTPGPTDGTPSPTWTHTLCVSDCTGKANGDYQSCNTCHGYVTCVHDLLYENRPCAVNTLVWDDNKKYCDYTSETCTDSGFTEDQKNEWTDTAQFGAKQYVVFSIIGLFVICVVFGGFKGMKWYKRNKGQSVKQSQIELANVIQQSGTTPFPGPTHVNIPSNASMGTTTTTGSTDNTPVGIMGTSSIMSTDSANMPEIIMGNTKGLRVHTPTVERIKSYSVDIGTEEMNTVTMTVPNSAQRVKSYSVEITEPPLQ